MKLGIVAYGDESIQRACEPAQYLLAATVYAAGTDPSFALRRAKPSGSGKLHWYDLDPKRQAVSLGVISSVSQQTTIVAALPLEGTKIERARRKALEEIVRRLIGMGISKLVLESRNDTHPRTRVPCQAPVPRQTAAGLAHEETVATREVLSASSTSRASDNSLPENR